MAFRIVLGLWLTVVVVLSLSLPMVARPEHWYDLPIVPGLEDKARIIFFHVPTAWLKNYQSFDAQLETTSHHTDRFQNHPRLWRTCRPGEWRPSSCRDSRIAEGAQ